MSDLPRYAVNIEHQQLIQRLLSDRRKKEALEWLKASGPGDERLIGECRTNYDSIKFVEEIYAAGALEILAVRIHKILQRKGHRTGKLVVKLPLDAESRKRIFDWCKRRGESLGFTPNPDLGETYLFLLLD